MGEREFTRPRGSSAGRADRAHPAGSIRRSECRAARPRPRIRAAPARCIDTLPHSALHDLGTMLGRRLAPIELSRSARPRRRSGPQVTFSAITHGRRKKHDAVLSAVLWSPVQPSKRLGGCTVRGSCTRWKQGGSLARLADDLPLFNAARRCSRRTGSNVARSSCTRRRASSFVRGSAKSR